MPSKNYPSIPPLPPNSFHPNSIPPQTPQTKPIPPISQPLDSTIFPAPTPLLLPTSYTSYPLPNPTFPKPLIPNILKSSHPTRASLSISCFPPSTHIIHPTYQQPPLFHSITSHQPHHPTSQHQSVQTPPSKASRNRENSKKLSRTTSKPREEASRRLPGELPGDQRFNILFIMYDASASTSAATTPLPPLVKFQLLSQSCSC